VFHSLTAIFGVSGLANPAAKNVMLMLHAGSQPQPFVVPKAAADLKWRLFVDTAADPTADVYPHADGPPPPVSGPILLESHALRCYVAD
jgi:hypothetical protein